MFEKLRHPIVLVPGFSVFANRARLPYFGRLPRALARPGNEVCEIRVPICQTIDVRALALREQLEARFGTRPVNLIAHSAGGLDARYLLGCLGSKTPIVSLTTIGTPHRGTSFVDYWFQALSARALAFLDRLYTSWNGTLESVRELSEERIAHDFTPHVPHDERVACYSVATYIDDKDWRPPVPFFWYTEPFIRAREGLNDGVTSVQSASWQKLITVESGDHHAQIGQPFPFRYRKRHLSLFARILRQLQRDGH